MSFHARDHRCMTRSGQAFTDHYATLGVSRTASGQQIASRGVALLNQLPTSRVDVAVGRFCDMTGRTAPTSLEGGTAIRADSVREAIRVLTDPTSRSRYNSELNRQNHRAAVVVGE